MDFSICSIVSNDKFFFDLNLELTARLNNGKYCDWIVVRNFTEDENPEEWIGETRGEYQLIDGVRQSKNIERRIISRGRIVGHNNRGFYHSAGLQIGARHLKSRYVLFLDPDLYIIRPNWIEEVINHMEAKELTFFGVPYHPVDFIKPRYFPSIMCLFIDTKQVDITKLNFDADSNDIIKKKLKIIQRDLPYPQKALHAFLTVFAKVFNTKNRCMIENMGDVGINLFNTFRDHPAYMFESATPVLHPKDKFSKLNLLIDHLLPNRYRYVSRRPGFYTERDFASFKKPDLNVAGCHEYLWKDEPFAFHLRGSIKPFDDDPEHFRKIIHSFSLN